MILTVSLAALLAIAWIFDEELLPEPRDERRESRYEEDDL